MAKEQYLAIRNVHVSAILSSFTTVGNTGMAIGDSGVWDIQRNWREENKRNSARNAPELVSIFPLDVGKRGQ